MTKEGFALLGIEKATVLTLGTICFNDNLSFTPPGYRESSVEYLTIESIRPLVKALLDAGIPVDTYWKDIDYTVIDPRLPRGFRT